jgi:alanine-glyoxylate transaminase/serine-glyoxylate transaminase/serine-pyruvate transaminase
MDPAFLKIAEETKDLLRYVWQTKNAFTIPCSGTGSAAMEAVVANLTKPGDVHLVCVNGYFGERQCDMAGRYKAQVERIDKPHGEVFSLEEIKEGVLKYKPQLLWICHAETSTGARQPLEGIADICRANDCLFVVDTVTSIGGVPLLLDEWGIDASYAGSQKCLSCPPGVSPLTFGPRAVERMQKITADGTKAPTWYLDMSMIAKYLVVSEGAPRVYHHTAPISMVFALHQALYLVAQEGLEASWKRHQETAEYLWGELEKIGLELHVKREHRLPSLTTVKVPQGIDATAVLKHMREKFNIEIGGGLGALAGKVWRIGMMGFNSRKDNVILVVAALKDAIDEQRKAKF